LVLLRVAAALALVDEVRRVASQHSLLVILMLAVLLLVRFLTRYAAAAFVLVMAAYVIELRSTCDDTAALQVLDGAALSLLRAGAYSVDAKLFGRRVIRLDQ